MRETAYNAILSAAASSAMEGIPLSEESFLVVEKILNGEMTLQEYFESIKLQYRED